MRTLEDCLAASAAQHGHLCPRQVLGVRMGRYACRRLDLEPPDSGKRLLAFVETDGCFVDGVTAATRCHVGHRTMRVIDFGKVALTLVDTQTERAVRVVPRATARAEALHYAPETTNRWKGQLLGYQRMPDELLLHGEEVQLRFSLDAYLSKAGCRVNCDMCGEEILNEREVRQAEQVLCRACAGAQYYGPRQGAHAAACHPVTLDLLDHGEPLGHSTYLERREHIL